MARIPYFDLAQAQASYSEMLGSRPPLNLYRMLPHAGKAAEGFLRLGGALLRDNELDSRLREIAILRVGLLSNASYEVHQHRRVARKVGLADAKVAALEPGADHDHPAAAQARARGRGAECLGVHLAARVELGRSEVHRGLLEIHGRRSRRRAGVGRPQCSTTPGGSMSTSKFSRNRQTIM